MAEPTATSLMYDWSFKSHEECQNYYANVTMDGGVWCNATWDHILCWPPSPPDTQVELPCPPLKGVDPTHSLPSEYATLRLHTLSLAHSSLFTLAMHKQLAMRKTNEPENKREDKVFAQDRMN
ncbi:pigment dispersing hormone receptor [Penaeus vannamei]|uniref:Pigment dispersing hormone receptor n=1 Tax=Penaeus vannamei TaxID=6689 RepID=A0A3R7QTA5_PENVA|nr:pigment dispersing hormone receptor [Penaeus vannamei]